MVETIITTTIQIAVGGIIGYLIGKLKVLKAIKNAMMILLQSNLTNTYFAYESIGKIPYYVYKNWLNELKEYENLGGNDYIHILADKMKSWEIIKNDK